MTAHESLTICPGLFVSASGKFWVDSVGRQHDLSKAACLSLGETAIRLNRSRRCVRRKIAAKEIYPVRYRNARDIEVFVCGIDDYLIRKVRGVVVRSAADFVGLSGNDGSGVLGADAAR